MLINSHIMLINKFESSVKSKNFSHIQKSLSINASCRHVVQILNE